MSIKITDNFQVNIKNPIDNRFVVGSQSIPGGIGSIYPTPFYSYRDDISSNGFVYPGLRIWDFNSNLPYVWTGTTWSNENLTGASVYGSGTPGGTGFQNYITKFQDNNTVLTKSLLFDDNVHVSLGSNVGTVNPNGPAGSAASVPNGLHVSGHIRTNYGFVGIGKYITGIDANNISEGSLNLLRISTVGTNAGTTILTNINGTTLWKNVLDVVPFWEPTTIGGGVPLYNGLSTGSNYYEFFSLVSNKSLDITPNGGVIEIEIKESLQNINNVSTDINIYKEFDTNTKKHKLRSITTSNLDIKYSTDGDEVIINVPVSESNKSFYVDTTYSGAIQEGSEAKPFKTLNKALDAFIDTAGGGTWYNPKNKGYKITLLSFVSLLEAPGQLINGIPEYTGRVNLDINNLWIVGNGYYLGLYANPPGPPLHPADYYPISTRRMVDDMPKTGGKLNFEIVQNYENMYIQRTGTNAIIDHLSYSSPQVTNSSSYSPQQPTSGINLTDVTLTNDTDYNPVLNNTIWETIDDPDNPGSPANFFGNTIYVSKTQPIGVPMLKNEGMGWNKEGTLRMNGKINLANGLGTLLEFKQTTFTNSGIISFGRNQTRILYQDIVLGQYFPRLGQYYITIDDCRYIALNTNGPSTIPTVKNISNISYHIGGSDCWLKAINNSLAIVLSSYIEGGFNNIFQIDGGSSLSVNDSKHNGAACHGNRGYCAVLSGLTNPHYKSINLYNVICNGMKVSSNGSDVNKIRYVYGEKNIINGYSHNNNGSAPGIPTDPISGQEYRDNAGTLKRVP